MLRKALKISRPTPLVVITIDSAGTHINGGESGLEGSVPQIRNRYFSFNLFYSQTLACYLVNRVSVQILKSTIETIETD